MYLLNKIVLKKCEYGIKNQQNKKISKFYLICRKEWFDNLRKIELDIYKQLHPCLHQAVLTLL